MGQTFLRSTGKKTLTVTGKILLAIVEIFDDMNFAQHHQGLTLTMGAAQARAYLAESKRFRSDTFTRLKRKNWIVETRDGEKIVYRLTAPSKIAMLKLLISMNTSLLPPSQMLFVSFDVPEVARTARNLFRNSLKQMKFKKIHQSYWQSKHDVGPLLKKYFCLLKIGKWATIIIGKEI